MKNLLLIFLLTPLISFSQEKVKYEREITFSQFAKELKEAAKDGEGYSLTNCIILYDTIQDKKYINFNSPYSKYPQYFGEMIINDLKFHDTTEVRIEDCKFGNSKDIIGFTRINFSKCNFGKFIFNSNDVGSIDINESKINYLEFNIKHQKNYINFLKYDRPIFTFFISKSEIQIMAASTEDPSTNYNINTILSLDSNKIETSFITNWEDLEIEKNTFTSIEINSTEKQKRNRGYVILENNIFKANLAFPWGFWLNVDSTKNNEIYAYAHYQKSLNIEELNTNNFYLIDNYFEQKKIQSKNLFNKLLSHYLSNHNRFTNFINVSENLINSELKIISKEYNGKKIYNDSLDIEEKINFLKHYINENNIKIRSLNSSEVNISYSSFNNLKIKDNNTSFFSFYNNVINEELTIKKLEVDSLNKFSNNTFPDYNRVYLDASALNNLGFTLKGNSFYGNENFSDLKKTDLKEYSDYTTILISQYRQFINIFNQTGNDLKSHAIIKLKNIQTNQKKFEYYINRNLNTWFNWKGSEFLKWYSDYGMNPFKALSYCFWAIIYFAMFYFIFYNEWDKINRDFLMQRFNSVMDYFTTEKKIEDFYTKVHNEEMTTFTEFKDALNKNKVYMPTMLITLAKPIYQISLLRYRFLNYSYKKAEFMAGRKWIDLQNKEKYLIGTLTLFLTIIYIIYLISIRTLNSVVLSINAFSTLGFGQIPVRGFTKYVAIIEGFIGWFLLSIFLVSVLSQMMSI